MKSHSTKFMLAALLLGALAAAPASAFGQDGSMPNAPIAGGYSAAAVTDPEVVAAAKFAVKRAARKGARRAALVSVEGAERQVVAGMNYRLRLKVRMNGKTQDVTAVVYRDLKGKYELTSWKVGVPNACG